MCSQLNVSVQADWKSCQFSCPVFKKQWQESMEIVLLEKSFNLGCATPSNNLKIEAEQNKNDRDNFDQEEISFS